MLTRAVQSYLAVRRAAGYTLRDVGLHLRSFAAFSDACGQRYVNTRTAVEWARQVPSINQRARRLANVARFARYVQAEDARHEIPPPSSVVNIDHDGLLSFFPMSRLRSSSSWPPNRGTGPCAARPIAPYLRYCPVRAFGSLKPFGCATKISLRMGL
jgi:hypothetical protein